MIKTNIKTKSLLKKNLVKAIKQGEPWLYADALETNTEKKVAISQIIYKKKNIAWGIYDPNSPLRIRILTDQEKFSFKDFEKNFRRLIKQKQERNLNSTTNTYRLVNGEGDFFPGLIIDIYAHIAVLQFDGEGPYQFYDKERISEILVEEKISEACFFKARNKHDAQSKWIIGDGATEVCVLENSMKILVDIQEGQKTGFFIDQKQNRDYLKSICKNKSVLNLFSYTGGFSIAAGQGGASRVVSVDIAKPAIEFANKNWLLNGFSEDKHQGLAVNVFDYLDKDEEKFDVVVCDPPSFSSREEGKHKAVHSYVEVFTKAAKKLKPGGALILSSCSSHIRYEEFFEIARESVSNARKKGKLVYMGSQAPCHSYPLAFLQMQYLKFLHIDMVL
ncbi:MAG: class I SAM-dependent rRNA methyltransferase [Bdellovibrionota bacterium]|nr:class I SAM-dependent rRNA methyltransferase [Bdellovibrionota bacterium]